jgi:hypothetical protein
MGALRKILTIRKEQGSLRHARHIYRMEKKVGKAITSTSLLTKFNDALEIKPAVSDISAAARKPPASPGAPQVL